MSSTLSSPRTGSWLTVVAWAVFAMMMTVVFIVLRYVLDGRAALVLSQVVYGAAPALAVVSCGVAYRMAPRSASRSRAAWLLLSIDASMLFIAEASYSVYLLWPSTRWFTGPSGDVAALVAVLLTFAALARLSGVGRLGWRFSALGAVDSVALASLSFVVLFRYWMLPFVATAGVDSVMDAVRATLYSVVGVVLFVANLVAGGSIRLSWRRPWTVMTLVSIGLYSLALVVWPLWSMSASGVQPNPFAEVTVVMMLLAGYWLLFLGGVSRVALAHRPWQAESLLGEHRSRVWPDMIVSTIALSSVIALGTAALSAPDASREELVYVTALAVASITLVLRTLLLSAETSDLIERATTDPVSGARNLRSLNEWFGRCAATYRRKGSPFGVIVLDLDGFNDVNDAAGWHEGDRLLSAVASALTASTGQPVFRLSSDEFALIVTAVTEEDIDKVAHAAGDAVKSVRGPEGRLSASVGWASCPTDGAELDSLLVKADRARSWARRHGAGNVVHYDVRIAHPAMVGEWQQLATEQARVDVARALAAAADARDPAHFSHSRNVAALAVLLAEEIGLNADDRQRIEMAALLHDIGMIALPDSVVEAAPLGRRAQARLRDHPQFGEELTQALGVPGLARWIRSHHENWDGSGYPDGLAGEEIPLEARIIALADAYDTMTAPHDPRGTLSKGAALQEIDLGMGSRFDPHLAEHFIIAVAATEALGWSDRWPAA